MPATSAQLKYFDADVMFAKQRIQRQASAVAKTTGAAAADAWLAAYN
jgi:hypothetical protein